MSWRTLRTDLPRHFACALAAETVVVAGRRVHLLFQEALVMDTWDNECLRYAADELPGSDSLLIDQLPPLVEQEIAAIESLCEAVGPGPLVFDDQAGGEGAVVATLPDGRHIVSLAPAGSPGDPAWIRACARLICQARPHLLRLLGERRRWRHEREELLARLESLEAEFFRPSQPR